MIPRQSPGLGYKRVMSCKDSLHGNDLFAVSEHAPRLTAVRWQADKEAAQGPLVNRPGAKCRIPIIASHPEHPFPVPENFAAKGVCERKRSVPRLSRLRNPAKRLK